MKNTSAKSEKLLLTGATGYIGGRILHRLEKDPRYRVCCLARKPENVNYTCRQRVQIVKGDLLNPETLPDAFKGVSTAFFLVHAMGSDKDFEAMELRAAENFAAAAKAAGVKKIIYLGALGEGSTLSPHLSSRQRVGEILRDSEITTIEFRASIIIGSGSLSFEMLRSLTERLPIMITPRWVNSKAQPISIEDVLSYLLAALERDFSESRIFEIGGPDRLRYRDLMDEYARQRGLKRIMIPVPVLTPHLSSLWLGLITPVYARIGRKLVDSLRNDTVVNKPDALKEFDIKPLSMSEAMARALTNEDHEFAETHWYDAVSSGGLKQRRANTKFGSRIVDIRSQSSDLQPEKIFLAVERIGGSQGWYCNFLWTIRGWLDLLVGGVGMRRGRPHPTKIRVGDPIDCWRVESYHPARLLRLRAEMKLPGRAWLQFEASQQKGTSGSTLTQTAIFDPIGLFGLLYWYALYPLHSIIFKGMLQQLCKSAEKNHLS